MLHLIGVSGKWQAEVLNSEGNSSSEVRGVNVSSFAAGDAATNTATRGSTLCGRTGTGGDCPLHRHRAGTGQRPRPVEGSADKVHPSRQTHGPGKDLETRLPLLGR